MESQLRFLLAHVRMGHQRRYQTWFATRFLAAPESESLVADLIRFVCCSVHPTNQVLQSDVVPRWAIVGWLLKCCRSCHMEANAKLALFYDWLFFMPKTDNIMNIEPAMLCMVHSLPKYAIMTNSLLEFLFLLLDNYDAAHRDVILRGISASIDILRDGMGNIVGSGAGIRAAEEQRGKEGQVAELGEVGEVGAGVSGSHPVGGSAAAAVAGKGAVDASGSITGARAAEDAEMGEASAAGEDQAGGKGPGGAGKRSKSPEGAEMELGERAGGESEAAEGGSGKRERKRKREEKEEGEEEAEEGGDVEAGEKLRRQGDGAKVIGGFKAFLVALRGEYPVSEAGGRKPQGQAEGKAQGNEYGELEGGQEMEKEGKGGTGGTAGRARERRPVVNEEQRDEEDARLDEERSDRSVDSDRAEGGWWWGGWGGENQGEQREEANAMDATGGEEGQRSGKGKEDGEGEQDGEATDKDKGECGGYDLNFLLPVEELLISWHDMGQPGYCLVAVCGCSSSGERATECGRCTCSSSQGS
ncbi:unnamed protein product [Closterium sp. NIES-65]|nr:unnamed protein product [Closterium sp. NIES-65]